MSVTRMVQQNLDDADEATDDQDDGQDADGQPLTQEVAELIADRCGVEVDQPSDDPTEFLEQLAEALESHPGWQRVSQEEEQALSQATAPRRRKGAMLKGKLSHPRKKPVPRARLSAAPSARARRGAVLAEVLANAGLVK